MTRKKAIRIELERPREFDVIIEVEGIKEQIIKYLKKTKKPITSTIIAKAFNHNKRHSLEILNNMELEGTLKSRKAWVQIGNTKYLARLFELV
jgi:hypothetical protein